MTDETKQMLNLQLSMLKQTMKDNGVVFAFAIDKLDIDNSGLLFMDKEPYLQMAKRTDSV